MKKILFSLLFLCGFSFGQSGTPLLSVVAHVDQYQVNPTSPITGTLYTPTNSGLYLVTVYEVGSSTVFTIGLPNLILFWSDDYVTEDGQTAPNQQAGVSSCSPYFQFPTEGAPCAVGGGFQNTFSIRAIAGYPITYSINAPGFAFDYHIVLSKIELN